MTKQKTKLEAMIQWAKYNWYFIIVMLIFFSIFLKNYNREQIKSSGVLRTIARTTDFSASKGRSSCIKYYFYVAGKKYENCQDLDTVTRNLEGKYFIVEYALKDPNINDLLFNEEIKDETLVRKSGVQF